MIARIARPARDDGSRSHADATVLAIVSADRRTWTAPDGSVWAECDPGPHRGSGKPAICGIPLADYCPRAAGPLPSGD